MKNKESYEKYLDKIISRYTGKKSKAWLVKELLDIKERVITQRHYKGWDEDKISMAITHRYNMAMYGIREPAEDDKLYDIIRKVLDGAVEYESLPSVDE